MKTSHHTCLLECLLSGSMAMGLMSVLKAILLVGQEVEDVVCTIYCEVSVR